MSEHTLVNSIVEFLNYHGHKVWRQNAGMVKATNRYGQEHMIQVGRKGISDIIGISKTGRFIAIEVKLPKNRNKVTFYQNSFLEDIYYHGGISGVACSEDEALEIVEGKK